MTRKRRPVQFELCDWDPERNSPAVDLVFEGERTRLGGCRNPATLTVGARRQWHLCVECAALPKFRRYWVRKPVQFPGGAK